MASKTITSDYVAAADETPRAQHLSRNDHDPATIHRLRRVREVASVAFFFCLFVQILLEPSVDNMLAATLAAVSGWAAIAYVLTPNRMVLYPISGMAVLGASFVTSFGGLIFQTLYLNPIITNLEHPIATFLFGLATTFTLVATHHLYRRSHFCRRAKINLRDAVYKPLRLFVAPRSSEILVMGIIGLVSVISTARFVEGETVEIGDVSGQFLLAFRPLSVLPLLAIVPKLYGGQPFKHKWPIALYFVALIVAAAVSNARSTFAFAMLNTALAACIFYLNGAWRPTRANTRALVTGFLILLAVTPVLYRLSGAMLAARATRAQADGLQLLQATATAFMDGTSLQTVEEELLDLTTEYNEVYTDNQFVNRTLLIKYTDLIYTASLNFTPDDRSRAREESWASSISFLPQPILDALGSTVDKSKRGYSSGDFYNTTSGRYNELGSFLTGSSIVDAFVIFGPLSWFVLGLVAICAFVLKDALVSGVIRAGDGFPIISLVALANLSQWFTHSFAHDSFAALMIDLLRSFPQSVFMYVIVFGAVRILLRALTASTTAMRPRFN